ncbi:MAG: PAS domain S-box protein [SAR324 cluster bacterium]|nr:PAS domain S-box protein [SAR324 cluster bacterium]
MSGSTKENRMQDSPCLPLEIGTIIEKTIGADSTIDALTMVFDAIESTVGGLIITDLMGNITYANQAFLSLFEIADVSEILGSPASDFFASKEISQFDDVITIVDNANGATEEFIAQREDGSKFFVEVSASSVKNKDGVLVGRMASFVNIDRRKTAEEEKDRVIKKLQRALKKIEKLQGLIPMCAWCKNIRDDQGYWHQVEAYIAEYAGGSFSHGICPECYEKEKTKYTKMRPPVR